MSADAVRRAFAHVAGADGPRLVSVEPDGDRLVVRGRTAATWPERLRFEGAFADALGDLRDRVELSWLAPPPPGPAPSALDRARDRLGLGAPRGLHEVGAKAGIAGRPAAPSDARDVPGVKRVLAVASGKGGVGKSTLAVNLAAAFTALGHPSGLLDADIYGPSLPTMLGTFAAPVRNGEIFEPARAHGMPFLSLGLMVNPEKGVIWRGPLVQRMVRDMLQKTAWPDLDVLVVDLPPGTGDVQLTLVQKALLSGALLVTTPQDVARIDAARGLEMFRRLSVPVLGLVENMAAVVCADCGAVSHPFGVGGGEDDAKRFGVPFLGRVPLDPDVRADADQGTPAVLAHPDSPASRAMVDIAASIATTWFPSPWTPSVP